MVSRVRFSRGEGNVHASDDAEAERALAAIESLPPGALGLHPSHLNAVDSFAVGTIRGLANASCPRHMATAVCDVVRHLAANCARLRSWREEEERSGASLGAGAANGDDVADGDEPAPAPSTDDLLASRGARGKGQAPHPVSGDVHGLFHAPIGSQHVGEIGYALANFYGAVQHALVGADEGSADRVGDTFSQLEFYVQLLAETAARVGTTKGATVPA